MKRHKLWGGVNRYVVMAVFSMFLIVCATGAVAADKTYYLKMQTLHASGPTLEKHENFAKQVRDNTDGKLIIKVFPSGAIVPAAQMAQAVSQGTIDLAFTYGGYHAGWIDIANIECGLPMAWGSVEEAALFHLTYGFQELAREAYHEKGIYWMTPVFENAFLLISKKPVRSIADLQGKKIRATSSVGAVLNEFDISTVYLPAEEFYTSLATGIIDGIIYGSWFTYEGLKLSEQAKYITDMRILSPMTSAIVVNEEIWKSLPQDLRSTLEDTAKSFYRINYFTLRAKDDLGARKSFEDQLFPAEDVARLTKAAGKVWDKEAAKSERAAKAVEMLRNLARDTGRL